MDDKTVHDLLDGALAGEPPIGPVAQNALTAGLRLRRRRRRIRAAAATAVAAVIAVAIPAGLGAFGHLLGPARPQQSPAPPTLYIYSDNGSHGGTVTPVNTATGTHGKPIHVGLSGSTPKGGFAPADGQIAITPDGKTAYLITGSSVTPVSTATGTPGKPIHISGLLSSVSAQIVITPDGKTVYVTTMSGTVVPISTATNMPGKPIHVGATGFLGPVQIAITPDGKTAYVTTRSGTVTPINTATNIPGKPIPVVGHGGPVWIAFTPDGKTAYVTSESPMLSNSQNARATVTPISTATGMPGTPIPVGGSGDFYFGQGPIAFTPDGKTAYVGSESGTVIPISTATGTPGKPIHVVGGYPNQIVITPDGKTAYVLTTPMSGQNTVIPISTATNTPGKPIEVARGAPLAMAITP